MNCDACDWAKNLECKALECDYLFMDVPAHSRDSPIGDL